MAHFPTNALPAEFEQEHGSVDLADAKPVIAEDGGEDEDLGIEDVGQRVWLVKVGRVSAATEVGEHRTGVGLKRWDERIGSSYTARGMEGVEGRGGEARVESGGQLEESVTFG